MMPHTSAKTHIVCDLSDVLISGIEGIEQKLGPLLELDVMELRAQLFSREFKELWLGRESEEAFLTRVIGECKWELATTEFKALIRAHFAEIPGTRIIYQELSRCYKLILLSVNSPEWVEFYRAKFDYERIFRGNVHYSFQLGYTKREVESYRFVLAHYNVCPENTLVIDDSARNLSIAKSLGIDGIQFHSALQLCEELEKYQIDISFMLPKLRRLTLDNIK